MIPYALPARRSVVLVHVPGTANREHGDHFDWLIEMEPDGPLFAFRTNIRPDVVSGCHGLSFAAQRLPDHRRKYLEYEGPIAGNRGVVTRCAEGQVLLGEMGDGVCVFTISFVRAALRYEGKRDESSDGLWWFRVFARTCDDGG